MSVGSYFYYRHTYGIKVKQGQRIDNIIGKGKNSELISLESIQNKFILIQFWASWCSPCVREIPELKRVYNLYNKVDFRDAKGFEIYSYSFDYDRQKWQHALDRFDFPWPYNVCDTLAFKSPIAKRFNVVSIPSNILVDPDMNVVGINLSGDEVEEVLSRFVN